MLDFCNLVFPSLSSNEGGYLDLVKSIIDFVFVEKLKPFFWLTLRLYLCFLVVFSFNGVRSRWFEVWTATMLLILSLKMQDLVTTVYSWEQKDTTWGSFRGIKEMFSFEQDPKPIKQRSFGIHIGPPMAGTSHDSKHIYVRTRVSQNFYSVTHSEH